MAADVIAFPARGAALALQRALDTAFAVARNAADRLDPETVGRPPWDYQHEIEWLSVEAAAPICRELTADDHLARIIAHALAGEVLRVLRQEGAV